MATMNGAQGNGTTRRGNRTWYRFGKGITHALRHAMHYIGESKFAIDQADYEAARAASIDGMFRTRRRRGNRCHSHRSRT